MAENPQTPKNPQETLQKCIQILEAMVKDLQEHLDAGKEQLEERDQIIAQGDALIKRLQVEIMRLSSPPTPYGVFVRVVREERTERDEESGDERMIPAAVDIFASGRIILVEVDPSIDVKILKRGQHLRLAPNLSVIEALDEYRETGSLGTVSNVLSHRRAIVKTAMDEKKVMHLVDSLNEADLAPGVRVLYDRITDHVLEIIPEEEKSSLQMEEIKTVTYEQIGGLTGQVEEFEEHIVLPRLHPDLFSRYKPDLPKGAVFYGPPGCGKTLLARAVAYRIKHDLKRDVQLFVGSGPEFLIKWVGDSEHKVREPAEFAKAHPNTIVMYIVDEVDAISRTRGSAGGHAGVNDSIVTQFNTILDGFIEIPNLIFIGITNRLDLVDSSMLRPGRLDLQLKIPRPDKESAKRILQIYLTPDLPLNEKYLDLEKYPSLQGGPQHIVDHFIEATLDHIYGEKGKEKDEKRKVATIEFIDTEEKVHLFMKDFVSGALLKDIINKAKLRAALTEQKEGEAGIKLKFLHDQVDKEFKKLRDQINRTHSQEWARIADLPSDKPFRVLSIAEEDRKASDFSSKA